MSSSSSNGNWTRIQCCCIYLTLLMSTLWGIGPFALGNTHLESSPHADILAVNPPWVDFEPVTDTLPMSGNLTGNASFETVLNNSPTVWKPYFSGFNLDTTSAHSGNNSIRMTASSTGESYCAYQVIYLNQTVRKPVHFSAWSKAEAVSGSPDSNYSLYVDVYHTDGTTLYNQTLQFDTNTHDWQFLQGYIITPKPIERLVVYCMFRATHAGTVWFDDIAIQEMEHDLTVFDGEMLATLSPTPLPYSGQNYILSTNDGLSVGFSQNGGAMTALSLGNTSVLAPESSYLSGFTIRDLAANTAYWNCGGDLTIEPATGDLAQNADIPALSLNLAATYHASPDHISIHANITDTSGLNRVLTVYYAIPVDATDWEWGDDIRNSRVVGGITEYDSFGWQVDLGARGRVSLYPWSCLSGPAGGLAIAQPMASPRVSRIIYNPINKCLYIAFDIALSADTAKMPSQASVDILLYTFPGTWKFRAAAEKYYQIFPQYFYRRIPPSEEGLWVAHTDLSAISGLSDFGIKIHEIADLNLLDFDQQNGILSFRYLLEPWSHWVSLDAPGIDPANYNQVMDYVYAQYSGGNPRFEATLSSGFFTENGEYLYETSVTPWCNGISGCATFVVNPDPDIYDPTYPLNKAHFQWSASEENTYITHPELDGEYVDSFLGHAEVFDFRPNHFAACDIPLTYRTRDLRVGIPEVFATIEFSEWLGNDVHQNLNKYTMANAMLTNLWYGANLFDYLGREIDFFPSGIFSPDLDKRMNFRRTLCYKKPYGFLLNTDFSNVSYSEIEQYMQFCIFYGIYPSMFSQDAYTNSYWENPTLLDRDRPLFKKYMPILSRINSKGWEPITNATATSPDILIERFGSWPQLFFTLRNSGTQSITTTVTINSSALNVPANQLGIIALVSGQSISFSQNNSSINATLTLAGNSTEVIQFIIPGDLNLDSVVNNTDLIILLHYLNGDLVPSSGVFRAPLASADLNSDGYINAADLQTLAYSLR